MKLLNPQITKYSNYQSLQIFKPPNGQIIKFSKLLTTKFSNHQCSKSSKFSIFQGFKSANPHISSYIIITYIISYYQILKSSNHQSPQVLKILKSPNHQNPKFTKSSIYQNPQIFKSLNHQILKTSKSSNHQIFKSPNLQITIFRNP